MCFIGPFCRASAVRGLPSEDTTRLAGASCALVEFWFRDGSVPDASLRVHGTALCLLPRPSELGELKCSTQIETSRGWTRHRSDCEATPGRTRR